MILSNIVLDTDLLSKATITFGVNAQVDKAIEGMAELIKALLKRRSAKSYEELTATTDAVLSEIADVYIMLAQLTIIYAGGSAVSKLPGCVNEKMNRLEERLERLVKS